MPANNYYALRARIASDEYMRNDRETQDSVRLSDIRMMSIRDFDTAPTVMSSEFIERGAQVRDSILGAYSKYGDAVNKDFTLRSTLDLAMSLVLNKPYESVAKNHDAYKRIFTGQDLDDKSLGTAMADAWNSDQIANDIATLQRRKDATDDPEEEAFLEKQIMAKEREAVRLGDYSSVRGWFGDQLVKTAMIAPQVGRGAVQSVVYALAFAALSHLVSPVGAGMLLNGTSVTGGTSLLGWLSSMARNTRTAAQIGSAVGNTMYLVQNVLPREYGTKSRELEQLVDEYGNHMDKETRKKAASVYAVASTLIEFMTPEPGLGKLMYGIAPKAMTSTSFMGWLKRVGVNMLQGGASESLEEAIQDFVGSFVQDVAKSKSNEKGTTNYELESFLDRLPGYVSQGFSTFMDTLVPSMIVGIPGAVTSSSLATYLTNVANEKDSIFRQASDDGRIAAMNTQKITSRAKIVPSIPLEYHLLIVNFRSCLLSLVDMKGSWTDKDMRVLYSRLMQGIDDISSMRYRDGYSLREVRGKDKVRVDVQMETLLAQYESWKGLNALVSGVMLYGELERIGPFEKYSSFFSFLVLSGELLRSGFLPPMFSVGDREEFDASYFIALKRGNYKDFTAFIESRVVRSYRLDV